MYSLNKFLLALFAWEVVVIGTLVTIRVMQADHTFDKSDFVPLVYVAVYGLLVTAAIVLFSRRLKIVGAIVTGFLCGLAPSVLIFGWAVIARPGFEEGAGAAGFSMLLAAPSAVGGAIAGLVSSRSTKRS